MSPLDGLNATRAVLDPRHPETARLMGDPHRMHGLTMTTIDASTAHDANLLWRTDVDGSTGCPVLSLQAGTPLRLDTLHALPYVTVREPVDLAARLTPALLTGSAWRLQTRVCATKTERKAGGKSRRVPLRQPEQVLAWLTEQTKSGFVFADDPLWDGTDAAVDHEGPLVSESRRATWNSTRIRASVIVTDTDRFAALLRAGVGRGKAFGFGLLQAVPGR